MTNKTKFGLKPRVINELYRVFEGIENLDHVIIYGSRARGDFKPRSDIDLAITSESKEIKTEILWAIEEADILLHVDVVNLKYVESQKFLDNVKEQGIIFWEREK
jgi:uncharacterized protein